MGVDFHVGSILVPTTIIDVAVWLGDRDRIARLLEAEGWKHAPEPDEDGGTGYERDAVRLELTFLVPGDGERFTSRCARVVCCGPDEPLGTELAELSGVRARVLDWLSSNAASPRSRDDHWKRGGSRRLRDRSLNSFIMASRLGTPVVLLAVSVGVVLADSSVVTIALPDILARYHVEISTLAWVLTAFNLALALSALPAAFLARRRPAHVFGLGILVFTAASLACGFSPSFGVLVAGRAMQGVAGAAVVCAALDLLSQVAETEARAARTWTLAGIVGAALGPAVGGILTQFLGWESIFFVQAPVVLLALIGLRGVRAVPVSGPAERPHVRSERCAAAAGARRLVAASSARDPVPQRLAAQPIAAGLAVTVMQIDTIAAARFGGRSGRCGCAQLRV